MWIWLIVIALAVFAKKSQSSSVELYSVGAQVLHYERAYGCHPDLIAFLNWWQAHGPFDILVAADGGNRTDAIKQASYCATGTSNACTLESTPHGRGCGLDVYPVGFNTQLDLSQQPEILEKFKVISEAGEAFGLTSGIHFHIGPSKSPDYPHLEVTDWRQLPFPHTYV